MKYIIRDENGVPLAVAQIRRGQVRELRGALKAGHSAEKLPTGKSADNYGVQEWSEDHTAIAMIFG